MPVKNRCYTTYVRPTLEYAASVWDPTGKWNLEATQNRCARWVVGDWRRTSSVSAMVASLQWQSRQERRARMRMHMLYKIVNGAVDIPTEPYLIPSHLFGTRGAQLKFERPHTRLYVYQHSFFPASVSLWNLLPPHVTDAPSLEVFRARLAEVNLTKLGDRPSTK